MHSLIVSLTRIKDNFSRVMKRLNSSRRKKKIDEIEVELRSPIEKSLAIVKTLRETDEGRKLDEELNFVISTLKKSENRGWVPQLHSSSGKQKDVNSYTYKDAVENWLDTSRYSKKEMKYLKSMDKRSSKRLSRTMDSLDLSRTSSAKIPEEDIQDEDTEHDSFIESPWKICKVFDLPQAIQKQKLIELEGAFRKNAAVRDFFDNNLGDWNLDVFELNKISNGKPLFYTIIYLFKATGMIMNSK